MSTEQSTNPQPVNPQAVEETKQQIRALVSEIANLTRQEVEPDVFYAEFLQRVITALAAVGGAVWVLNEGNELRLMYQSRLREAFPDDEHPQQHFNLLKRVLENGEHMLVPPYSGTAGDDEAGNPTSYLLVLAPLRDEEKVRGVVEIFQRPTSGPASQRGYLRFLTEMCQHAGDYLRSRRLRELNDWQSLFTDMDRFSLAVHEGLDPVTTAYTIANDARRLIGCDRVSVALRKGSKCTVRAVSGQDTMDTRSNAVTLLSKLSTAVMRSGESLWFTGNSEDLPPQIETAVQDYVDETHTKTVAVIPLRRPNKEIPDGDESKKPRKKDNEDVVGALVVEQIEDSRAPSEFAQSVDMVCKHSSRALANSMEHDSLFLMPVWRTIGKAKWIVEARTLPKTLAVFAAVLVLIAFMCFFPWDFDMEAPGSINPTTRRNVFVDREGTVAEVLVKHGDIVTAGQELVRLENPDLNASRESLNTDLLTATQEQQSNRRMFLDKSLTKDEKNQLRGNQTVLATKIAGLQRQLQLVEDQLGQLVIRAPIAGEVVTWDVRDMLINRPMARGDVVLTIAEPDGQWEIEAFMEEDRMGHVARYLNKTSREPLSVRYILMNDPENEFEGVLQPSNIHDAAQLHDEHGHAVRMLIDVNEENLSSPRPGTEVTIKVRCGKKPVGYVLFHEVVEFIQSTLLF